MSKFILSISFALLSAQFSRVAGGPIERDYPFLPPTSDPDGHVSFCSGLAWQGKCMNYSYYNGICRE